MHPALETLYALQQEDSALMRLKRQLAALDDGASLKSAAEQVERQLQALVAEEHRLHADLKDAELQLKTVEEKINHFEKKLYSGAVVNPKELSALEKDIESLKRFRSELDEKILILWEEAEQNKAQIEATRTQYGKAVEAYEAQHQSYLQQKAAIEKEASLHLQQRQALTRQVDSASLQKYDALRPKLGGVAVAKVENSVCTVCHTAVTAYNMTRLKEDAIMITCESCGRLLYLDL